MSDAKHILIVDDEPNVRLVFRTALESSGYTTTTAEDGEAALESGWSGPPSTWSCWTSTCPAWAAWRSWRDVREAGNEVPVDHRHRASGSVRDGRRGDERRHRLPGQAACSPDLRRVVAEVLERRHPAEVEPARPHRCRGP